MMIASIEPATVKANCLEDAVSSSARRIADLNIRSNKSNSTASIIKKKTAELLVQISCFEKFICRSCDRITANRYTRNAFLLTLGLTLLTISRNIRILSNDISSALPIVETVSRTN